MKQEIKEKWIAALRSGEYEQTSESLQDDGSFCCLGVLCELAIKDGVLVEKSKNPSGEVAYDGLVDFPPAKVVEYAGLKEINPVILDPETQNPNTLADLNDSGYSFRDIAKIIEEQL